MFALLTFLTALAAQPAATDCVYDHDGMLALDFVGFDQTEGQGWRPLYDSECYIEAAEILRDWQAHNSGELSPDIRRERQFLRTLAWHEAQMWAFAGRDDMAMPIFDRLDADAAHSGEAWNLYVDGTIAFLRRDRKGMELAIANLTALPKPPGWDSALGADGEPISMAWPQNLDVLEGLRRCWDEPYRKAYLCREIIRPR